jgi:hypothetical protein
MSKLNQWMQSLAAMSSNAPDQGVLQPLGRRNERP